MKTIGITIGEPSGIGPEVVLKSLPTLRRIPGFRFVILSPAHFLQRYARALNLSRLVPTTLPIEDSSRKISAVEVFDAIRFQPGKSSTETGKAAYYLIRAGITHAMDRKIDALVTAPVCKYAINRAGIKFTGHTEMLRDLVGVKDVLMFFVSPHMKVGVVTTHIEIRKVASHISKSSILSKLGIMDEGLRRYFGIRRPSIAVSALNPHAGEAGFIGKEDRSIIQPAILEAQQQGLRTSGPFPADTILLRRAAFDASLFMYHDQAMIPVKLLAWGKNVNTTLGLPFVRTSPDHGAGLDIAGKGTASPSGFISAVRLACAMVAHSKKRTKGMK